MSSTWDFTVIEYVSPMVGGSKVETQFGSAYSAGVTTIQTNDEEDSIRLGVNDVLQLGPSSSSSNLAYVETARINTITRGSGVTTITLQSAIQNAYSSGDTITGISSGLPDGWTFNSIGADADFRMLGSSPKTGTDGTVFNGYDNEMTGFAFVKGSSSIAGVSLYHRFNRPLIYSGYYTLGAFFYQPSYSGTWTFRLKEDNGTTTGITFVVGAQSSWNNLYDFGQLTTGQTDDMIIEMFFPPTGSTSTFGAVDMPYLGHAMLTDGQASGTLSLSFDVTDISRSTDSRGNSRDNFYGTVLNPLRRRAMRLMIEGVTQSQLRQLEILSYWQGKGNMIMVENSMYTPVERPIIGYLYWDYRLREWDTTRVDVSLEIIGI